MALATRSRPRSRTVMPTYSGPYAQLINRSAARTGIDAWLLAALLFVESKFNPHARSNTGDVGIAQINLASHPSVSEAEALNPHFAIPWAAHYLADLKRGAGSTRGALRAYNTGSSAASVKGSHYAKSVLNARTELKGAHATRNSALSSGGYAGVDQGVDYTKPGPIPALAAGIITAVGFSHDVEGQKGRLVVEKLTAGPHKGEYVYVAENFEPTVRQGQRVQAGQIIGRDKGITSEANARRDGTWGAGIEIGFNQRPDRWLPVAPLNSAYLVAGSPGETMYAYIRSLFGRSGSVAAVKGSARVAAGGGGTVSIGGKSVPASVVARLTQLWNAWRRSPKGNDALYHARKQRLADALAKHGITGDQWTSYLEGRGDLSKPIIGIVVPPTAVGAAGAAAAADGIGLGGLAALGALIGKILSDPGYIVLWLGFAIVGLAFIFLGIERLLGRSARADAASLVAAPGRAAVGVGA